MTFAEREAQVQANKDRAKAIREEGAVRRIRERAIRHSSDPEATRAEFDAIDAAQEAAEAEEHEVIVDDDSTASLEVSEELADLIQEAKEDEAVPVDIPDPVPPVVIDIPDIFETDDSAVIPYPVIDVIVDGGEEASPHPEHIEVGTGEHLIAKTTDQLAEEDDPDWVEPPPLTQEDLDEAENVVPIKTFLGDYNTTATTLPLSMEIEDLGLELKVKGVAPMQLLTSAETTGESILYRKWDSEDIGLAKDFDICRIIGTGGVSVTDDGAGLLTVDSATPITYTLGDVVGMVGKSLVNDGAGPLFRVKGIKGSGDNPEDADPPVVGIKAFVEIIETASDLEVSVEINPNDLPSGGSGTTYSGSDCIHVDNGDENITLANDNPSLKPTRGNIGFRKFYVADGGSVKQTAIYCTNPADTIPSAGTDDKISGGTTP